MPRRKKASLKLKKKKKFFQQKADKMQKKKDAGAIHPMQQDRWALAGQGRAEPTAVQAQMQPQKSDPSLPPLFGLALLHSKHHEGNIDPKRLLKFIEANWFESERNHDPT